MAAWGMATAKSKLSEVVHEAETTGPQTLTRSGRQVAVVVSMKQWKQMQKATPAAPALESMADFLLRSPLRGSELKIERPKWKLRDLEL